MGDDADKVKIYEHVEDRHPDNIPIPRLPPKHLGPKYETSHTEDWEITFRATVPAGLKARGEMTTASSILIQRMTDVLMQAGVADPQVQVRKVGRNSHRGQWEGGVEYAPGETVEEVGKLWLAIRASVNRPPHSNNGWVNNYWEETLLVHYADALFAPPKALPPQRLVEATNPSGDEIMAVVDAEMGDMPGSFQLSKELGVEPGPDERTVGKTLNHPVTYETDDDVVDAELVDDDE